MNLSLRSYSIPFGSKSSGPIDLDGFQAAHPTDTSISKKIAFGAMRPKSSGLGAGCSWKVFRRCAIVVWTFFASPNWATSFSSMMPSTGGGAENAPVRRLMCTHAFFDFFFFYWDTIYWRFWFSIAAARVSARGSKSFLGMKDARGSVAKANPLTFRHYTKLGDVLVRACS